MRPAPLGAYRRIVSLALALAAGLQAGASRADDGYATDDVGRRMRVVFDPGRRIHVGAQHAPTLDAEGDVDPERLQLDTGLRWRHYVDFAEEQVRWKLDHRVLSGQVSLGSQTSFSGELYSLHFLRFSNDGSISLPTTPPRRLAFPFGIGFDVGLGRVELEQRRREQPVDTEPALTGEIGVARGALLLDLTPRPTGDGYLTFGVGPRYDLRLDTRLAAPEVDHLLAPFSQPELAFHRESDDGHHVFDARARAGYVWSSLHGAGAQAAARVGYELIVLALNDAPVSLTTEVRWRWDEPPIVGASAHEVVGLYGLRLGIPLDR